MKFKKFDLRLILAYLILPPVLVALFLMVVNASMWSAQPENFLFAVFAMSLLGWAIVYLAVSRLLFSFGKKKAEQYLAQENFYCNYIFHGSHTMVAIDMKQGKLAFTSRWNPLETYIAEASEISEAHTDDGVGGFSIFKGTSVVRFAFTLAGNRYRIPTFTSNSRWSPDAVEVLEGISKADLTVENLLKAKDVSLARQA